MREARAAKDRITRRVLLRLAEQQIVLAYPTYGVTLDREEAPAARPPPSVG